MSDDAMTCPCLTWVDTVPRGSDGHHDTCRHSHASLLRDHLAALDELDAWRDATGLVGPGGDPSTVTPARLASYIARLHAVADAARRLVDHDGAGAAYDAGEARRARAELRGALAALPEEV